MALRFHAYTGATLVRDGISHLAESCIKQPLLDLGKAECGEIAVESVLHALVGLRYSVAP